MMRKLEGGVKLAQFKFFMVGSAEAPILEVPFDRLSDLHDAMVRTRFVEGRMVEINGHATSCGVLIPMGRIQLIAEADAL